MNKSRNTKGQAALEFLMTYGWAMLVVLAAIGALAYMGVLSPNKYITPKCVTAPGITCPGAPIFNSGVNNRTVYFTVTNNLGTSISFVPRATPGVFDSISSPSPSTLTCTNGYACPAGNTGNALCTQAPAGTATAATVTVPDGSSATIVLTGCTDAGGDLKSGSIYSGDFVIHYTNAASLLSEKRTLTLQGRGG